MQAQVILDVGARDHINDLRRQPRQTRLDAKDPRHTIRRPRPRSARTSEGERERGKFEPLTPSHYLGRDQAEHVAESLGKGTRVVVVGRLVQRSWQADNGTSRSVVEVVADELGPSLRWATATTTKATRSQAQ
jgi:hypothetical protein